MLYLAKRIVCDTAQGTGMLWNTCMNVAGDAGLCGCARARALQRTNDANAVICFVLRFMSLYAYPADIQSRFCGWYGWSNRRGRPQYCEARGPHHDRTDQ